MPRSTLTKKAPFRKAGTAAPAPLPARNAAPPADEAAAGRAQVLQRLRAGGLHPTTARIGIYQTIAAAGLEGATAKDVFQSMFARGTRAAASSVYRILREFSEHGLVSVTLNGSRTAVFFVRPSGQAPKVIRFECARTHRLAVVEDADLHARLLAAARQSGLRLDGRNLLVRA